MYCINNHQIGFVESPNDYLSIEIDEDFILSCYPLSNSLDEISIPFSAKLNISANKLLCDHSNIAIIDYGARNFIVSTSSLTLPNTAQNTAPFYTTLDDTIITINKHMLNISNGKLNLSYPLNNDLFDVKATKNYDFIQILGKLANEQSYLLLLNKNLQVAFEYTADKIEFDGTKIVTLKNLQDIARHGIVSVYQQKNGAFIKDNQYSVFTQNEPISPACPQAIPQAFMEALNIENYSLARTYLHPSLSTSLKNEHLRAYFGDFIEVRQCLEQTPYNLTLVYNGNPRFTKTYHFDIRENRITNIDYA